MEIEKLDDIDKSEVIIPIEHSVVDGVYTRIAYAKANTIIVGCPHKKGGTAILLSGTIQQIDNDEKYEISAPKIFNTKAGTQRIAKTLTDTVYATCHSTEAETVEEAERILFEGVPQITRIQNSFNAFLLENKKTEDDIKGNNDNLPCVVEDSEKYVIAGSIIHGQGCFATSKININDSLGIAIKDGKDQVLSRFLNHSDVPNCEFITLDNGDIELIATKEIDTNMELLVDYGKEKVVICQ